WATANPVPEYNFAQLPLVRGIDPLWIEKMEGNKTMTPAEPLGDIHMPSPSFKPFMMAFGLFVAAFGLIYHWFILAGIGFGILLFNMFLRSVFDDHGYHIHKEELSDEEVKA
ncbi:MAG: cytochrome ubiquinol oxidase subunit I, partial [Bacilli bacterium]